MLNFRKHSHIAITRVQAPSFADTNLVGRRRKDCARAPKVVRRVGAGAIYVTYDLP